MVSVNFNYRALKDSDRATLAELDEKLIQRQSLLVDVLPSPSLHTHERWWWFLHEGVQVVPQAKQPIAA